MPTKGIPPKPAYVEWQSMFQRTSYLVVKKARDHQQAGKGFLSLPAQIHESLEYYSTAEDYIVIMRPLSPLSFAPSPNM